MIFKPGTWLSTDDLKEGFETFTESFAHYLDSDECDDAVKEVVNLAKKRYDKKMDKERKKQLKEHADESQNSTSQQSQESEFDSQFSSQSSLINELHLGRALLKDISEPVQSAMDDPNQIKPLFTGGVDFDWHNHGIDSLNIDSIPPNASDWLDNICDETEKKLKEQSNGFDLPKIDLLLANDLQRVIIGMNLEHLLSVANSDDSTKVRPLRLLI